jgi:hypothetical protein
VISDDDLVEAMAIGDQAAFEAFIHRYHEPMYGYLERNAPAEIDSRRYGSELFIRLIRLLQTSGPPRK